jgi:hypothetical protein
LGLLDSEDKHIMILEMSVTTDAVIWHHIAEDLMFISNTVITKIPSLTFVRIVVLCDIICIGLLRWCFLAKLNNKCSTCPFRYRYI